MLSYLSLRLLPQVPIMTQHSVKKFCLKMAFKGTITLFAVKDIHSPLASLSIPPESPPPASPPPLPVSLAPLSVVPQPPTPPQFRAPPTPPPISVLPVCWRKVICRVCHKDSHTISHQQNMECHFKKKWISILLLQNVNFLLYCMYGM